MEQNQSRNGRFQVRNLEEFEYFQHLELLDSLADSYDFENFTLTDTDLSHLSNISDSESLDQALFIDLIGDEEEFEELDQELDFLDYELKIEEELIDEVVKCNWTELNFENHTFPGQSRENVLKNLALRKFEDGWLAPGSVSFFDAQTLRLLGMCPLFSAA